MGYEAGRAKCPAFRMSSALREPLPTGLVRVTMVGPSTHGGVMKLSAAITNLMGQ